MRASPAGRGGWRAAGCPRSGRSCRPGGRRGRAGPRTRAGRPWAPGRAGRCSFLAGPPLFAEGRLDALEGLAVVLELLLVVLLAGLDVGVFAGQAGGPPGQPDAAGRGGDGEVEQDPEDPVGDEARGPEDRGPPVAHDFFSVAAGMAPGGRKAGNGTGFPSRMAWLLARCSAAKVSASSWAFKIREYARLPTATSPVTAEPTITSQGEMASGVNAPIRPMKPFEI